MKIGELAALGAALCWTINGMLLGSVDKNIKANTINLLRLSFGFLYICVYTFLTLGEVFPFGANSSAAIYLAISGIIGFAIGDFFFISSIQTIGPRFGMLMISTSPILTAFIDFLFFNVKLSIAGYAGIFLTIVGISVVVLSQRDDDENIDKSKMGKGIFFGIMAALGQSVGTIFSKMGVRSMDPFQATQIRIIGGIMAMIIIHFMTKDRDNLVSVLKSRSAAKSISIAGLLGPSLGVGLSLVGLKYTSAGVASTLTSTMPIMILPFSIFYYREKLGLFEVLGTILSIVGIAILFMF